MPATPPVEYTLDPDNATFRIDGYNWAAPLSNFLPGIAGVLGVPAWAYWVNRAQAVCGVGVGTRDDQILELYSFNKACTRVGTEGFRTFIRLDEGPTIEPFRRTREPNIRQSLEMSAADLRIIEVDELSGLQVTVTYFGLPGHRASGLVRSVEVTDITGTERLIEWLDGAPRVLPRGIDRHGIKVAPRHIEAMFGVSDHDGVPVFRLWQSAADHARVSGIRGVNFYAVSPPTAVICDPVVVFGDPFDFASPIPFTEDGLDGVTRTPQVLRGRTPCAFTARHDMLPANGSIESTAVLGAAETTGDLDRLIEDLQDPRFVATAHTEQRRTIDAIADRAFTLSSSPQFDAFSTQTFLDNVLRGGLPMRVETSPPTRFHIYWRQNADLERDYHEFDLAPTYLSQGMGHYRNVLQNRRLEPWFHADIDDSEIATFVGLIQLDGFNPLEVRHSAYHLDPRVAQRWAHHEITGGEKRHTLLDRLQSGAITPGRLLMLVEAAGVDITTRWQQILADLLQDATLDEVGALEAGFWIDHWHYNLDLIEAYLAIYPDRLTPLLLVPKHSFFDNPDVVLPFSDRVTLIDGVPRQVGSVVRDVEKSEMIESRQCDRHRVRTESGHVFRTSLLVKLLVLAATRLASIDPGGRGIEMEAGKPGWNDSLNGLPSVFGSGHSELIELRRLLRLLLEWLDDLSAPEPSIEVFGELGELIDALQPLVGPGNRLSATQRWRRATVAKEHYRAATRLGVVGTSQAMPWKALRRFLMNAKEMVDATLAGADGPVADHGVPHTYYSNDPMSWEDDTARIESMSFSTRSRGIFLEGAVHRMREFPDEAASIYRAIRESDLYDEQLGMYRVSGLLAHDDSDMGRAVGAYPPGWLENGSVYTHMEYKYLIEVLRSGMYQQFWDDAVRTLTPFLDPNTYRRSPLENVSFIVSTLHPDPTEHGRGYQPRLSGVTTEFLNMWVLATVGPRPFRLDSDGDLVLAFEPALPGWLFTSAARARHHTRSDGRVETLGVDDGSFAFRLLGDTTVVLHNPERRDTFGPDGVHPRRHRIAFSDGGEVVLDGASITTPHAEWIRLGRVERIDIDLG